MAVVAVNAPCTKYALHIAIMPRSAYVIHHLVAAVLNDGGPNFAGKRFQYFVPGRAIPLAFSTLACTLERIQDAFGVIDLVDSGRSLGAVTSSTARVIRITLKFFDPSRLFIHVSHQSACRFTVKTDGRNYFVMFLYFARPRPGVIFNPIVPAFRWWARGQVTHSHLFAARRNMLLQRYFRHDTIPQSFNGSFSKRLVGRVGAGASSSLLWLIL